MNKQHSLHRLIQSLDPSEKAYFKKFGFKRENKNNESFLAIFNVVDKQLEFDVDLLKANKIVNPNHKKNIHAALNTLFKLIVQNMLDYRKDKGVNTKLFNMISEFQLLQEKKLLDLSEKKINQIEQYVEEKRMYFFQPYVYHLRGSKLRNNIVTDRALLKLYLDKVDLATKNLQINTDIIKTGLRIESLFHENGGIVNKSLSTKEADDIIKNIDESIKNASNNFVFISVLANNRFIVQMIFGRMNDIEKNIQDYLSYFDKNIDKHYSDNELGDTLVTLKNYAVVSIHSNNQNIYENCKIRLEIILKKYQTEMAIEKLERRLLDLKILNFAINGGAAPSLKNLNEIANQKHEELRNKAQYAEALLANMIAFVRLNYFEKAIDISDTFIQNQYNERIRDEYISIRLIRAVCWFKLESTELFNSELNSIYRKLKGEETHPFQMKITQQFKRLDHVSMVEKNNLLLQEILNTCKQQIQCTSGSMRMKLIEFRTIISLAIS